MDCRLESPPLASFYGIVLFSFWRPEPSRNRARTGQGSGRRVGGGGEEMIGRGGLSSIRQLGSLEGGESHMEGGWKEKGFPWCHLET